MGNFAFAYNLEGGNQVPVVKKFPVATTQTLVRGDAVVLSSGQVAKASTTFGRCLGVMAQDSDGADAGTMVEVYVAQPNHVWKATASADATNHVLAARTYDLNSSQVVNVADTDGGCIQIVELAGSTTAIHVQFTACELG